MTFDLRFRLRAGGAHLLISLAIASTVGFLVWRRWYPWPYGQISGGLFLLFLIVAVDVVLGPLLTVIIFSPSKPRKELVRDVFVIAIIQATGLWYGVHTLAIARPVLLVYEVDRFRVIAPVDVLAAELPQAPLRLREFSTSGPVLVGAREPTKNEANDALDMAFKGYDVGQRPTYWVPYEQVRARALAHSHPIADLLSRNTGSKAGIGAQLLAQSLPAEHARFLPLQAKNSDAWVVVLDETGQPVGFLPYNGF